ncbi:MAG: hypothetical protein R3F55_01450 [Alphaproteobacteria bacterium]
MTNVTRGGAVVWNASTLRSCIAAPVAKASATTPAMPYAAKSIGVFWIGMV